MALERALRLLFVLAAMLMGLSASETPNKQYERFLRQHFAPKSGGYNDKYCTDTMRIMMVNDRKMDPNPGPKVCKEINTFIHGNSDDIKDICTDKGGEAYEIAPGQVMRRSRKLFKVTICKHHGGKPLENCTYRAHHGSRKIVICCDKGGLPTHFAESQT